jgi:hypothetical protein
MDTANLDRISQFYVIEYFLFRPTSAKCDGFRTRPFSGVDHEQSVARRKDTFSESANTNLTVDGKPGYESVVVVVA